MNIPDIDPDRIKDPSDWTTGDEPMTGAQEPYLKTLARRVGKTGEKAMTRTKAEASEKIDELREMTGLADDAKARRGRD